MFFDVSVKDVDSVTVAVKLMDDRVQHGST